MNVNEVLANRALELLGLEHGAYERVSPLDDLNLHQSTNDTYPTALQAGGHPAPSSGWRNAWWRCRKRFRPRRSGLPDVVKVGRTQLQDAVLTTLGREMSAYAEAINRDRWRIYKCEERLRVVNLGGTAIGTGLAAPREFIFRVVDALRELTGIGFARAENLVDATQNADVFVEVSGHSQGARRLAAQDLRRPALAGLGAGSGLGRTAPAGAAGGVVDHAGQSESRDSGGREPGGDAGHGPRRDHRERLRRGQPGTESVSAAGGGLPAR